MNCYNKSILNNYGFMSFFSTISARDHYGLRLIMRLAQNYHNKEPLSLSEVSKQENISLKYLEQLITPFRKAGLVKSQRGRSGGYLLSKNPNKISLKEVINLLNNDQKLIICLKDDYNCECPSDHDCSSKLIWHQVQKSMDESLKGVTLSDFLNKTKK